MMWQENSVKNLPMDKYNVTISRGVFDTGSHWNGLLEYPQYSCPLEWNGRKVPEVLLSGNHANIARWRRKQALKRTMQKRPDMFERFAPDAGYKKLIDEIIKENEG